MISSRTNHKGFQVLLLCALFGQAGYQFARFRTGKVSEALRVVEEQRAGENLQAQLRAEYEKNPDIETYRVGIGNDAKKTLSGREMLSFAVKFGSEQKIQREEIQVKLDGLKNALLNEYKAYPGIETWRTNERESKGLEELTPKELLNIAVRFGKEHAPKATAYDAVCKSFEDNVVKRGGQFGGATTDQKMAELFEVLGDVFPEVKIAVNDGQLEWTKFFFSESENRENDGKHELAFLFRRLKTALARMKGFCTWIKESSKHEDDAAALAASGKAARLPTGRSTIKERPGRSLDGTRAGALCQTLIEMNEYTATITAGLENQQTQIAALERIFKDKGLCRYLELTPPSNPKRPALADYQAILTTRISDTWKVIGPQMSSVAAFLDFSEEEPMTLKNSVNALEDSATLVGSLSLKALLESREKSSKSLGDSQLTLILAPDGDGKSGSMNPIRRFFGISPEVGRVEKEKTPTVADLVAFLSAIKEPLGKAYVSFENRKKTYSELKPLLTDIPWVTDGGQWTFKRFQRLEEALADRLLELQRLEGTIAKKDLQGISRFAGAAEPPSEGSTFPALARMTQVAAALEQRRTELGQVFPGAAKSGGVGPRDSLLVLAEFGERGLPAPNWSKEDRPTTLAGAMTALGAYRQATDSFVKGPVIAPAKALETARSKIKGKLIRTSDLAGCRALVESTSKAEQLAVALREYTRSVEFVSLYTPQIEERLSKSGATPTSGEGGLAGFLREWFSGQVKAGKQDVARLMRNEVNRGRSFFFDFNNRGKLAKKSQLQVGTLILEQSMKSAMAWVEAGAKGTFPVQGAFACERVFKELPADDSHNVSVYFWGRDNAERLVRILMMTHTERARLKKLAPKGRELDYIIYLVVKSKGTEEYHYGSPEDAAYPPNPPRWLRSGMSPIVDFKTLKNWINSDSGKNFRKALNAELAKGVLK